MLKLKVRRLCTKRSCSCAQLVKLCFDRGHSFVAGAISDNTVMSVVSLCLLSSVFMRVPCLVRFGEHTGMWSSFV